MTVATSQRRVQYVLDGVTTVFPVPFPFPAAGDLAVKRIAPDGAETALLLNSDFTVTGAGLGGGGTLTFPAAGPASHRLIIKRVVQRTQLTDYVPNDPFPAEAHEAALDKLTMIAQEDGDELGRALLVGETDPGRGAMQLPPMADRAGKLLAFDAQGLPVPASGTGVDGALRADLALPAGAALIGAGGGQSLASVLGAFPNIKTFEAVGDGVTDDTAAFLAAEVSAGGYVYLPSGTYLVNGDAALTKAYIGPGLLLYSGIGSIGFVGGGLNDLSLTGAFVQPRPLQLALRVETTPGGGNPDTIAYSINGGVTWVTALDTYDPVTDQVTAQPIRMLAGGVDIPGAGVKAVFASLTGHTVGDRWYFMLRPNPQVIETRSGIVRKGSVPILHVGGVLETNTLLGFEALGGNLNNVGNQNTAIGGYVLRDNTTGYANTGVGLNALRRNTSGFNNTGLGPNSVWYNTSGFNNTGVGIYSLEQNRTGKGNTGVGSDAGAKNQTGDENTSVGIQAGYHNTAGNLNTAVGTWALRSGTESLPNGNSHSFCTAVGARALLFNRGNNNCALGFEAGYNVTSGERNVAIGRGAGFRITTGSDNVFLGDQAGGNASQLATGTNMIAIGDNAYCTGDNGIAIGSGVVAPAGHVVIGNGFTGIMRPTADNATQLGTASQRYSVVFAATGTINTSDATQKQWRGALSAAELAAAKAIGQGIGAYKWLDAVASKGDAARIHVGVKAQDVAAAFTAQGLNPDAYGLFCRDTLEGGGERLGVRYDELAMFLAAAFEQRLAALEALA